MNALALAALAALIYAGLLLPPVRGVLVAGMALQMLVQIPALILVGWLAGRALPPRVHASVEVWNRGGINGVILAGSAAAFWMLPRWLDAAVAQSWVAAFKFVSVPLLIGVPLGLSWPRMGFVTRGFVLVEFVAMLFRLGWLYRVTPLRLCNSYLLGDQQRTGVYMLLLGVGVLLVAILVLMGGSFDRPSARSP